MIKRKFFLSLVILFLVAVSIGISFKFMSNREPKILSNYEDTDYLAIYLEDEQINHIPEKDSGYTLDLTKSSCNNGVTISFDYNTWSVKTNYSNYTNPDNTRVKCSLYFTDKYIEPILNGTDSVLEEPLIPVTIEDDGVVKKADLASEWYDYETKKWANAVILEDESKNYASGEVISEENIESYFVWIPKYRYQLWDLGLYDSLTTIDTSKVHEIPIIFGDYNTSDSVSGECTTPMESGESGNCEVGDYMTHPAFLSIPSTGFWVGKFETGYKGATTKEEAKQNMNDISKIQIKPNVYSWLGLQTSNAHLNAYNYQRELDSHMMKNTEWGAVAYFQHSMYGSTTSVRLNNNSDYITGYQATDEPTCSIAIGDCFEYCNDNTCNIAYPNSILASTTENITGIFDMAGNSREVMMSFTLNETGEVLVGDVTERLSGFNGSTGAGTIINNLVELPEKKYYDLYKNETISFNSTFFRRILGDATAEMGPFYNEASTYVISSWYNALLVQYFSIHYPMITRGEYYASGYHASIFSSLGGVGNENGNHSFRIILTPTK